ncbi:nucleoside diphosphate kinase [Hyaloraphidium curvatum]|nr:nucleoside diphosphate kinase [Hyaloraphidium curvatum]
MRDEGLDGRSRPLAARTGNGSSILRCALALPRRSSSLRTCCEMAPPTVALLKPDFVARGASNMRRVMLLLETEGFVVLKAHRGITWNAAQASSFYTPHKGKWYLDRLVSNMSSGPFHALLLGRKDAEDPVAAWRSLLASELRPRYGISDTRNSFHGSSDYDEAKREAAIIWKE